MNLKFVSVALLALALASTMVLTGCRPQEETPAEVDVTTEEAVPTVVEEEAVPAEEGAMTEEGAMEEEAGVATEEPAAEEAAH